METRPICQKLKVIHDDVENTEAKSYPQSRVFPHNGRGFPQKVIHTEAPENNRGFPQVKPPIDGDLLSSPMVVGPAGDEKHPGVVINSVIQALKRRGVYNARALCRKYPLYGIILVIHSVEMTISEGVEVSSEAGLIAWRLEQDYSEIQAETKVTQIDYQQPQGELGEENAMGTHSRELPRELREIELKILRLLAEGQTNDAIAEQLNLPRRTIEAAVQRAIIKLEVPNRVAAVVKSIKLGLIDLDGIEV